MNEQGLEQELRDWLVDVGPRDVPAHVADAAIADARATRQRRPWPRSLGGFLDAIDSLSRGTPAIGRVGPALLLVATTLLGVVALGLGARLLLPQATASLIAFGSGGDIWIVRADGSGLTAFAATSDHEGAPRWSPDGGRLAYTVTRADDSVVVRVVDVDRSDSIELVAPDEIMLMPRSGIIGWSPDGAKLAVPARTTRPYGSYTKALSDTVVVFDVSTGADSIIDVGFEASSFGWSADGSALGILGDPNSQTADLGLATQGQIHVADADGGRVRPIVTGRTGYFMPRGPVFTGQADSILFYQEAAGRFDGDIYLAPVDGGEPVVLVDGPTNDVTPAVSPDGHRIAFSRAGTAGVAAAVTRWMASPERRLGSGAPTLREPAELWVAGIDGASPQRLGEDLATGPLWSPDGSRLVVPSMEWDALVVFAAEGDEEPVRIESPAASEIGAFDWQPRSP